MPRLPSRPPTLRVHWTIRPLGLRLTGAIDTATHPVLEQCLRELAQRFPGRTVHLDLTRVTRVDLAAAALVVATRDRIRRRAGDLRLHVGKGAVPVSVLPRPSHEAGKSPPAPAR
ncbi:STAS domain-containing protein [Streptomyces rimosus]|uniref:STAS domain-containing protein n=1 Tax=Streptomyces rimosus TaxID=1927 RepID=UPI0037CCE0E0